MARFERAQQVIDCQTCIDDVLNEQHVPADFLTVSNELDRRNQLNEIGGTSYLVDLIGSVPSAVYVEHYAHMVERAATLRRLIGAATAVSTGNLFVRVPVKQSEGDPFSDSSSWPAQRAWGGALVSQRGRAQ